jgi:hypothetical protein
MVVSYSAGAEGDDMRRWLGDIRDERDRRDLGRAVPGIVRPAVASGDVVGAVSRLAPLGSPLSLTFLLSPEPQAFLPENRP